MKIGVLGAGLMGCEVARDLSLSENVSFIGLADIHVEKIEKFIEEINSSLIKPYKVDASDEESLVNFMKQFDVIVNALFYSFNEKVVKTAIKVGVSSVDLGGHIGQITDKVLKYHKEAKRAEVTIIPEFEVAPGMINILTRYGASKLDNLKEVRLFVGGIPLRPEPPLQYNHVFSLEGMLDHYTDPSLIIRDSRKVYVPSLSEVEPIFFEKFGPLEAFHTSGGTSTLLVTYPHLKTLEYKTIRYPGHAEKLKLLVDLNLTQKDYVIDLDGKKVNPRNVLLKTISPILKLKDKDDVVLLRVIVSGIKDDEKMTYEYEMVTYKDRKNNVTAMARSTAGTVSVVAQLIANKKISKYGVFPPEQIVPGDVYIEEMKKRGVTILERKKKIKDFKCVK